MKIIWAEICLYLQFHKKKPKITKKNSPIESSPKVQFISKNMKRNNKFYFVE